jgi:GAF domain-containing protein
MAIPDLTAPDPFQPASNDQSASRVRSQAHRRIDTTEYELRAVGRSIEDRLRAARELLGMDIAWIAEFRDGKKVFRTIDGDGDSFGFAEGTSIPLDGSYCKRVALGVIPNVIPDTAAEPGVRDLEVTLAARIGAYVGIPIALVDGTVYGTLCVASHRPNGHLNEGDVRFLEAIARRVADIVDEERAAIADRPARPAPPPRT